MSYLPEENQDFSEGSFEEDRGNHQDSGENQELPGEEENELSHGDNMEVRAEEEEIDGHLESEGESQLPSGGEEITNSTSEQESAGEMKEEPEIDAENKEEPADNTLDGIEEIVKSEDETEDAEALLREEVVDDLAHIIEAIIFASDEPLTAATVKSVLDASHTFGRVNTDMISARISALNGKYEAEGSGFRIIEIANGYQFATRKDMAQWVSNLFKERSKRKLSNSALETLAIISYKQPITKPEIESIRGVNVDYVLHNLLEKEIVTVVGRAESVGRPLLYGTTQKFLRVFALKSLEDLPKLREIEEIIKEIKSKGAEESIQLEITALSEQASSEVKEDARTKQEEKPDDATEQQ